MKWIIVASVFVAASLAPIYARPGPPAITGSCASIGHSASCCPRDEDCQASDGHCVCSDDCHILGDCCSDVACPRSKLLFFIKPAMSTIMSLHISITIVY